MSANRRLPIPGPGRLRLLVAIAALNCAPGADDQPARDTTDHRVAEVTPPWYRKTRTLDLTNDGRADSVLLQAVGTRPDSLAITLSFIVDGANKHREAWGSSYELVVVDSAARAGSGVDTLLRARLDSVLASVIVQRLDAPGVQLMREDSTILARLDPRPTHRVSFAYGFETTARLVWDAPNERFVRLWSCC